MRPAWVALDLGQFLELHANTTGEGRRLFLLVYATMTYTLWTIRNKMVIEHVFPRRASDSVFKFLAFLQQWYQLCRQRDKTQLDHLLGALLEASRRLPTHPNSRGS
jgi:hypothetical protein